MSYRGITIELIGDSGSGKTTQAGELAKYVKKTRNKSAVLNTADRGGYDSISSLSRVGLLRVNELKQDDDPWLWVNQAVQKGSYDEGVGLAIFDSGTSISDILLTACAKSDFQIGQQRTQKFSVSRGTQNLTVSINNEAHFGVVQGFMLDQIRQSTWLVENGIDVMWTFALHRGESQDRTPILGPKLAGKALTPFLPKEFRYTFRIESIPQEGSNPVHRLYLTEHPELAGLGHSFGNARYPLGVEPLPPYVEPASLSEALELIQKGQDEADDLIKRELGL
jgi:energy-coupling factor transporter ATP-binding protein EcfA2